ncbi:MAG: hypothetical protein IJ733_03780, partial [Lachnospiraceae bacterium]|nr:hypothetical protein [Lachnospiraceae bacterium]
CDAREFNDSDNCEEDKSYPGYSEEYAETPEEQLPYFICDDDSCECTKCRYREIRKLPSDMDDPVIPWFMKFGHYH